MIVTYKQLRNITFPAFLLPSENWWSQDGVLFLDNLVLDERNMPGESLGVRRLQSRRKDLFPLKKAVFDIPQLMHSPAKTFIDSKGKTFTYLKTYSSKLLTYRIKRVEKKEVASLVWLHEIPQPFTVARPPLDNPEWAGILHLGDAPWILYDYVDHPRKATYRRV